MEEDESVASGVTPQRTQAAADAMLAMRQELLADSPTAADAQDERCDFGRDVAAVASVLEGNIQNENCGSAHCSAETSESVGSVTELPELEAHYQEDEAPLFHEGHQAAVESVSEADPTDVDATDEKGRTRLHVAAKSGDMDTIKLLVEQGANVYATDEKERTPLFLAAMSGNRSVVDYLLDAGADVDAADKKGQTPLHGAAKADDINVIKLLVERGADVDWLTKGGDSVLHTAAYHGSLDGVKYFVGAGADIHSRNDAECTPLFSAAQLGSRSVAEFLLDAGADVEAVQEYGWAPLHGAAGSGNVELIKLLLERGANIHATDGQERTPLFRAYNRSAAAYLIDAGADVHAVDEKGQTPLHYAAGAGIKKVELFELLVERGADMHRQRMDGKSVLHACARWGTLNGLKYFVGAGVNIHATDKKERTPLFVAALTGRLSMVEFLLDAGADAKAVDEAGKTPLHDAAESGEVNLIKLLVERGANVKAVDKAGKTPLHTAAKFGNVGAITLLVERGADVNSLTKDGRSPAQCGTLSGSAETIEFFVGAGLSAGLENMDELDEDGCAAIHNAAMYGDVKALELLLQMGADVNACYGDGRSALHHAATSADAEAIEFLLRAGGNINAKGNDGESVLHAAVKSGEDAAVKILLRDGANLNGINESNSQSAVHYAAEEGDVKLLKLLFESGDNMHAVASNGQTALHIACSKGKKNAVDYLLGLGLDVNALDKDGRTALHSATSVRGSGCVSAVLKAGSMDCISHPDKDGFQALHLSANACLVQETKELLEASANILALTNNGESPLELMVFAEPSITALLTASVLCSFGAEWTVRCQEKLMELTAEVEANGVDAADDRHQQLMWRTGLRACILHWEDQYRRGTKELTKVPIEVVQRGAASVKTYLDDATSSNADDVVYRCKVCVVGPSEWGKSSLVRSIEVMKPFLMDIKDRTVGVELVSTALRVSDERPTEVITHSPATQDTSNQVEEIEREAGNDGISSSSGERARHHEVTFWDFGGQDVYQVAHSVYFSRRTVYILVVDVNAYSEQLGKVESLRPAVADAAMDRFLSRCIFRWVRMIFARQTDAEFLVLGTKADLLEDEEMESATVWRDLHLRVSDWKHKYIKELQAEYGVVTGGSSGGRRGVAGPAKHSSRVLARIAELTEKLTRLASDKWLVVSVTRPDSIEDVRQALRHKIEVSERGFPMWNKYARVLRAVAAKRAASNRPRDGGHRLEHGMVLFRRLCGELMDEVDGLEYDECREIMRTLHDLGDVIWYEHEESGQLRDFVILDPMLVIDIVREVISHEHTKKTGVVAVATEGKMDEKPPAIDGRVSHSMLETFPLWKHMDKEMMYAFKMLLKQFGLAYPANDEVMDPESDLIVPSYWNVQLEAASGGHTVASATAVEQESEGVPELESDNDVVPRPNHHCWEYDVSADLASAIFEQFAVQSYTSFMKRDVRANCIESTCAEFQSWITLHTGTTIQDVIRVEVASDNADLSWLNMRYYLMKLEKVLDEYSGLAVPRYVVVNGKRHSLSTATKAVRDSIMMGRSVDDLRVQMPWLPPDLDWFMIRAWRDLSAFKELQLMHLVRDKLSVLQKLVVKGDSQRRYPALWSLEYASEDRVAVLRMLSDLSGRCYHVPIRLDVPPAFLAKHGSVIKDGVALLANVVSSSLSVPILKTALEGAVSCLDAKTQQAATVHNLIDRLDLTATLGTTVRTSKDSGLSPGGTMAVLRDLLKLHNDSLDELSVTEVSNLQCAATSKGEYVWAHATEISMLKKELTPCQQPQWEPKPSSSSMNRSQPHVGDHEAKAPRTSASRSSKLRLSLCVETVAGLADWDWYKTYCTWQLLYGVSKTPMASGATSTNADSTVQPSWRSLEMPLGAVDTVEMLQECCLVVQVKRRSRIGWTKLIGEGRADLLPFVRGDSKGRFCCDPIAVKLLANRATASDNRVVTCRINASD